MGSQLTIKEKENILSVIKSYCDSKSGTVVVSIDGRSGAGKSTIARSIEKTFGATIVTGDNFYSGNSDEYWMSQTVEERYAQVIDWRRQREEVLLPLLRGEAARWHPFDFKKGEGLSPNEIVSLPNKLIILEGIYSCRPELRDLVDLTIYIDVDDSVRRQRLQIRENPKQMNNWHRIWDDVENYYFEKVCPTSSFDVVFNGRTNK